MKRNIKRDENLPIGKLTRVKDFLPPPEKLARPDIMRQVRKSLKYFAKGGKGKTFEDVFGESLFPRKLKA